MLISPYVYGSLYAKSKYHSNSFRRVHDNVDLNPSNWFAYVELKVDMTRPLEPYFGYSGPRPPPIRGVAPFNG